jgi:hypothetical protein
MALSGNGIRGSEFRINPVGGLDSSAERPQLSPVRLGSTGAWFSAYSSVAESGAGNLAEFELQFFDEATGASRPKPFGAM